MYGQISLRVKYIERTVTIDVVDQSMFSIQLAIQGRLRKEFDSYIPCCYASQGVLSTHKHL